MSQRLENVSQVRLRRRRRLRDLKQVPVLPSLITLGNLFFGFLAVCKIVDAVVTGYAAGGGTFVLTREVVVLLETGAILIFVAMICDVLDGGVARLTNQVSSFGGQLDSMADMVAFGAAPAFMCKLILDAHTGPNGLLLPHPKLYYGAAAIYVLCAALRLARFNVESDEKSEHREFKGLPTPAAAAVVCAMIAFYCTGHLTEEERALTLSAYILPQGAADSMIYAMPIALVMLGLMMVSRLPFPHMTNIMMRGGKSFPILAALVVCIGLAAMEWQLALVVLTGSYLIGGISVGLYRLVTTGRIAVHTGFDDDEDDGVDPSLN